MYMVIGGGFYGPICRNIEAKYVDKNEFNFEALLPLLILQKFSNVKLVAIKI